VENVWNTGVNADSVRKVLVAAGDSTRVRRDSTVKPPVPVPAPAVKKAP
jgi:hypothetical protein